MITCLVRIFHELFLERGLVREQGSAFLLQRETKEQDNAL